MVFLYGLIGHGEKRQSKIHVYSCLLIPPYVDLNIVRVPSKGTLFGYNKLGQIG